MSGYSVCEIHGGSVTQRRLSVYANLSAEGVGTGVSVWPGRGSAESVYVLTAGEREHAFTPRPLVARAVRTDDCGCGWGALCEHVSPVRRFRAGFTSALRGAVR